MTIEELSKITGKGVQTLRAGARQGILPFVKAIKNEGSSKWTYIIFDKKVSEYYEVQD